MAALAVDPGAALEAQAAAEFGLFVGEDHPHARFGSGERGRNAGGAAAQHQHLAMRVARGIVVRIRLLG